MAGQFSDTGSKYALDAITGRATVTLRTTYLALCLAQPTDNNTTGTISMSEYGATGYARQAITWNAPAAAATASISGISSSTTSSSGVTLSSGTANGSTTQPFNTVTYTASAAHNLVVGQVITITGFTTTGFNLTSQTVTSVPTATTFTVTNALAAGTSTGTGTLTSTGPVNITYTTSAAHGFVAGQTVNITGVTGTGTPNQLNATIITTPSTTTFTIEAPAPATWTSGGTATVGASTTGPTALVTFGPFTAATGATITHAALVSASTGTTGDLVAWWSLDTARTPAVNDSITIAAGQLSLYLN
jgi:hypothetical protein